MAHNNLTGLYSGAGETDFTTPLLNYGQFQLGGPAAGNGQNMQGTWPHQAPIPSVNYAGAKNVTFNEPDGYDYNNFWDGWNTDGWGDKLARNAGIFSNVVKGIGSGLGAYTALMNYKATNKQLKHMRNLQNKNMQAGVDSHNTQLWDRQKARVASSERSAPENRYESVSGYMDRNRIT
jgi:hypothetical protein